MEEGEGGVHGRDKGSSQWTRQLLDTPNPLLPSLFLHHLLLHCSNLSLPSSSLSMDHPPTLTPFLRFLIALDDHSLPPPPPPLPPVCALFLETLGGVARSRSEFHINMKVKIYREHSPWPKLNKVRRKFPLTSNIVFT